MSRGHLDLICVIGPPGAGKTTLVEKLARRLAMPVVRPRDAIHRVLIRYPEFLGMFEKVNRLKDGETCARCSTALQIRHDDHEELFVERLARHRQYAKGILGIAHRLKIRVVALEATQEPESLAQQAFEAIPPQRERPACDESCR